MFEALIFKFYDTKETPKHDQNKNDSYEESDAINCWHDMTDQQRQTQTPALELHVS